MGFRFREWQIYKDARKFRREVIKQIFPKIPKEERFEIGSQLKRALDSVVLNIAEGAYRKTDKDLAHFLNQSETSLNEIVSCFDICYDDGRIGKNELDEFSAKAENLVSQLIGFSKTLQK